jgi:hypothetical protein
MRAWIVAALFFLRPPFWNARPPEKWSDLEIEEMLNDSPWAQTVGPAPAVVVYLATAAPIIQAEREDRVRGHAPTAAAAAPDFDYTDYLRQHAEESLVLGIPYSPRNAFGTARQRQRMEEECEMQAGRRSYRIVGYFPPAQNDPVLRLVFPRRVDPTDKTLLFHLYLPGIAFPERHIAFKVKDLLWRGKLEM